MRRFCVRHRFCAYYKEPLLDGPHPLFWLPKLMKYNAI